MGFYRKHKEDGTSCAGKYAAIRGYSPCYTGCISLAEKYDTREAAENDKYKIEYVVEE